MAFGNCLLLLKIHWQPLDYVKTIFFFLLKIEFFFTAADSAWGPREIASCRELCAAMASLLVALQVYIKKNNFVLFTFSGSLFVRNKNQNWCNQQKDYCNILNLLVVNKRGFSFFFYFLEIAPVTRGNSPTRSTVSSTSDLPPSNLKEKKNSVFCY